ncbi:Cadherin-99C, partial [Sarracenia purpurea var. burkii]
MDDYADDGWYQDRQYEDIWYGEIRGHHSPQSGSSIILDIEVSRGNQTNQSTSPAELPIFGDPSSEILLNLSFQKQQTAIFTLRGKRLQLTGPLDRDAENLSHVIFQ